jgi:hypothetical protein
MQNSVWMKGLVIGIIILFLGASVLPSITATVVNVNTDKNNINSSIGYVHYVIGLINDGVLVYDNNGVLFGAEFTTIFVISLVFFNDENNTQDWGINIFPPGQHGIFVFQNYTGIVNNHFICGKFIDE